MANIGNNIVEGSNFYWEPTWSSVCLLDTFTPMGPEELKTVNIYAKSYDSIGELTVFIIRDDTKALVYSTAVPISLSVGWQTVSGLSISLLSGVPYRIGFTNTGAGAVDVYYGSYVSSKSEEYGSSSIPDPWVGNSSSNNNFSLYATTSSSGPATPTVVSDDPITDSETLNTYTPANFAGAITSVTQSSIAVPVFTQTTFNCFDISAITTLTSAPRLGLSTLSVTDGTDTATDEITINPKAGWSFVELAGTLDKSTNSFLDILETKWGVTLVVGDIIYWDSSNGVTITATGGYTSGTLIAYQSHKYVVQQGGGSTTPATTYGDDYYPFGEEAVIPDTTPDQFDLGANVTGSELSTDVVRSFTSAGINQAITWTATGDATVSLSAGSGFGASVTAGNGVLIYVKLTSSASHVTAVTGGVTANSVSDSFSVTTKAEPPTKPVLNPTKSLSGTINQAFARILTQDGGSPATSQTITGGADAAQYTLSDSGLLERTIDRATIGTETVNRTATNAAGTSIEQVITITFSEASSGNQPNRISLSNLKIGL